MAPGNNRALLWLAAAAIIGIGLFGACIAMNKKSSDEMADALVDLERERQESLESKPAVPDGAVRTGRSYDWKIVGQSTIGRTVYMEPAAYEDYCFFADTFYRVKETAFEARTIRIDFYDDLAGTPSKVNRTQAKHRRAIYGYNANNGKERFAWQVDDLKKRAPVPKRCP